MLRYFKDNPNCGKKVIIDAIYNKNAIYNIDIMHYKRATTSMDDNKCTKRIIHQEWSDDDEDDIPNEVVERLRLEHSIKNPPIDDANIGSSDSDSDSDTYLLLIDKQSVTEKRQMLMEQKLKRQGIMHYNNTTSIDTVTLPVTKID
jgi:hypothetical protein